MNDVPLLASPRRLAITVRGVVQGVGFRPFIYQTAHAHGLAGWVRNESDTVRIEVQGNTAALDGFVAALRNAHPPQARIDAIDIHELPAEAVGQVGNLSHTSQSSCFHIQPSATAAAPAPTIPADLATCPECLAEIRDPSECRYRYPFTNCTNCGPRWSIIEQLPYDRPRTSMASFEMCADCRAEYDNPANRRFHAQPIACPRCGPALQLLDPQGRNLVEQGGNLSHVGQVAHLPAASQPALDGAVQAILHGQIVALKGLGGFQLLVDATNAEAVARLRQRKRRPDRPFALMLPSLDAARQCCEVSDEEARVLTSHQSPIVLLRRRRSPSSLSPLPSPLDIVDSVAPGNPYLGVMLPYTPLHHLLMAAVARPIVCTSGNLSDEPMAITTDDALRRLGPIADVLLTHNRPIVRPVDDSIVRLAADGVQVLRRARGFAPLPFDIDVDARTTPTILALGGHLKNTVALSLRRVRACTHAADPSDAEPTDRVRASTHPTQVVMSAHVGDLDTVLSVDVFRRAADDLIEFFQASPEAIVCDLHPDYASTRHAEVLAARWQVPLLRVQHHHAHVAACMAEHGLQGPVLGFSWDGTGYGLDGTVWGGEVLLCEGEKKLPSPFGRGAGGEGSRFRRIAHLRTFPLPGGDRAVCEPRRSALGLLFEMLGPDCVGQVANLSREPTEYFSPSQLDTLLSALSRRVNTPRTSSMGRLFDAVAAICGLPPVISFEGQAAMALEFAADHREQSSYTVTLSATTSPGRPNQPLAASQPAVSHDPILADWEPMIRSILADRAAGVPLGTIAARFHNALADMALAVARAVVGQLANLPCNLTPTHLPIVLTGGCFQNALLTDRVRSRLSAAGFQVYTHHLVPPGDGGIALGQILIAQRQLCVSESPVS